MSTAKPIFEVFDSRENCDSVEEGAADRDAVAAADQLAVRVPHLERMHVAGVEQVAIGAHDPRRDPGQVPLAVAAAGAGLDHALEVAVEGDAVAALPHPAAQPSCDMWNSSKNSTQRSGGDIHFSGPKWAKVNRPRR